MFRCDILLFLLTEVQLPSNW